MNQLSLCNAIASGDGCWYVKKTFEKYPQGIYAVDPQTKLHPFMLAAVGENSKLDTIFSLMIEAPNLVEPQFKPGKS